MAAYRLEQCWESGPAVSLQKMPIFAKKIIFSDEGHFDVVTFGAQKTSTQTQNESLFAADIGPEAQLSCHLTYLDYYLWGAVKNKCYAVKPYTIAALKNNIREAICKIQLYTIDNVLKNWTDRVGYCISSRGSNLNKFFSIINRKDCTFKQKTCEKKIEKLSNFLSIFKKKKLFDGSFIKLPMTKNIFKNFNVENCYLKR